MSSSFEKFEDLEVWQKSRALVRSIYLVSKQGAFAQDSALRDQIRRAVISVPSNIAEGYERDSRKEFINYLFIAKGSTGEVRAQLQLAHDLAYLPDEIFQQHYQICLEVSRMLHGLILYLKKSEVAGTRYKS